MISNRSTRTYRTTKRPGSRESAAVRRAFSHCTNWSPEAVYGDADVVTVVYPPPSDSGNAEAHRARLGYCFGLMKALVEDGCAPRTLRGVCHLEGEQFPFVWLLRREWVNSHLEGELDNDDVFGLIMSTSALDTRASGGE